MEIAKELDRVIGRAPGRVFVTTFASHIHRIQSVIWAAEKYGRKVAMEGRSMVKFSRIAMELGYLKVKDRLYALEEVMDLPDHQVLILATGSQGQPMSVLHRLAFEGHSRMAIKPGDTVILSSSPIPRQRGGGEPGHQPPLRPGGLRPLPPHLQGPRLGPRLPGGAQADPEPHHAQVLPALARGGAPPDQLQVAGGEHEPPPRRRP
jgi:hypothetical protein